MDYRLEQKFSLPEVDEVRRIDHMRSKSGSKAANRLTKGEKVYRDEINMKLEEIDRLKKLKDRYKTPMSK